MFLEQGQVYISKNIIVISGYATFLFFFFYYILILDESNKSEQIQRIKRYLGNLHANHMFYTLFFFFFYVILGYDFTLCSTQNHLLKRTTTVPRIDWIRAPLTRRTAGVIF